MVFLQGALVYGRAWEPPYTQHIPTRSHYDCCNLISVQSMSENLAWNVPYVYCLVSFTGVSILLAYDSARIYGGVLVLPYVKAPCE